MKSLLILAVSLLIVLFSNQAFSRSVDKHSKGKDKDGKHFPSIFTLTYFTKNSS